MRRCRWLGIAAAFLLGGCGIMPWNIRTHPNPTDLYPEDLQKPPSYVERVADAADDGGGQQDRAGDRQQDKGGDGKLKTSYVTSIHARFYINEVRAQESNAKAEDFRRYMESGMAYSNELCDRWFDHLERVQARANYGQGSFGIGGAFATTTMAIFSAATNEIAAVAAGFGGVGSWYELGKTVFLFTPDLHVMRGKIAELRSGVRTKILSGDMPPSYDQARIQLTEYHQLCSGAQVKDYLDKAIVQTKYEFHLEQELSAIEQEQVRSLGAQFSDALGLGKDAPDTMTLKRIYLTAFADDQTALDAGERIYFDRLRLSDSTARNEKAIALLKQIGALAGFDKDAERLKVQKADAAELERQKQAAQQASQAQPTPENQQRLQAITEMADEARKQAESVRKEATSASKAGASIVVDVVPITKK